MRPHRYRIDPARTPLFMFDRVLEEQDFRAALKAAGLTQTAFAEITTFHRVTVCKWCRPGAKVPTMAWTFVRMLAGIHPRRRSKLLRGRTPPR